MSQKIVHAGIERAWLMLEFLGAGTVQWIIRVKYLDPVSLTWGPPAYLPTGPETGPPHVGLRNLHRALRAECWKEAHTCKTPTSDQQSERASGSSV